MGKSSSSSKAAPAYFYDAATKGNATSTNYSFLNTVAQNKSLYTQRQIKDADLAHRVYTLVGRPSHASFIKMIQQRQLEGCPITADDANRAVKIYGPDISTLRGKTVRTTPDHIPSDQQEQLLPEILKEHSQVTLCIDLMDVDTHVFLVTVSRNLHFITMEHISSRHVIKTILPCIKKVINVYKARGFNVTMIHADEEFTSTHNGLLEQGVTLNVAAQTNTSQRLNAQSARSRSKTGAPSTHSRTRSTQSC
jgi:hypothetical protein